MNEGFPRDANECPAFGLALTVLSSETFVNTYYSPIFSDVFASLVIAHLLFPQARRSPIVYVILFILGIASTLYYLLGTVSSRLRVYLNSAAHMQNSLNMNVAMEYLLVKIVMLSPSAQMIPTFQISASTVKLLPKHGGPMLF